jgi:ribosomal protein S18 acetylase RimI-like enzyme
MRIRKLRESDIGSIVKIVYKVMGPSDAKKALVDLTTSLHKAVNQYFKVDEFYVVEVNGSVVGGGGVWALKYDPNIVRLDWFVVDPKYQRKGLATMLMRFFEKKLRKKKIKMILTETSSGKEYRAAMNFYTKNGFKVLAQIPDYWEDGTDWICFVKQ